MTDAAHTFHVSPELAQKTLSAALRGWLEGVTWGEARHLLKTRRVLVNGNLCQDAGRRLKTTDVVKVLPHPTAPLPKADDIRIRYLDAHLVVVEKPSGLTSVRHAEERDWAPKRRQLQPTLEDLVPRVILARQGAPRRKPLGSRAGGGAPKDRRAALPVPVRPVHRLDRETSGLMVFARTVLAERQLGQQFRKHTTERRYLAVVRGRVAEGTYESRLIRDRGDGRRGSTTLPGLGKLAVTHVRPLEDLGDYTLLECRLETGRTHQIRIHLAEAGHPLCGETVYNQPKFGEPAPDLSHAPRLVLHAAELSLDHPVSGERLKFEMPLPADLQAFVQRLRGGEQTPPVARKQQAPAPPRRRRTR